VGKSKNEKKKLEVSSRLVHPPAPSSSGFTLDRVMIMFLLYLMFMQKTLVFWQCRLKSELVITRGKEQANCIIRAV